MAFLCGNAPFPFFPLTYTLERYRKQREGGEEFCGVLPPSRLSPRCLTPPTGVPLADPAVFLISRPFGLTSRSILIEGTSGCGEHHESAPHFLLSSSEGRRAG